ncbi:dynamin family protein [Acinetobacter sp.]|uniref:dynamin family protein n=1 Tax=Acinetobacter sp. TaxID=472 RepID=UPI00388F82E2
MTETEIVRNVIDVLPEQYKTTVEELWQQVNPHEKKLRMALVGAFSVGKSSLLNSMLGERWLSTAQEEATALPTLIQYANEQAISLIGTDNTSVEIDFETFSDVTVNAPHDAKCTILNLPQEWLKNLIIIDLPGLGSVSEGHYSHTVAQIQQADVILYVVAPRGVTASDIQTLKLIQSYGKHLLIVVNRWDEVQHAASLGEKTPDLGKWLKQISEATGYDSSLICTHNQGLNQHLIFDFIKEAKEQVYSIRMKRFIAELYPKLENILGYNQEQQQANQILDEQQAQSLHENLLHQKNKILELKKDLYQQQNDSQTNLQNQFSDIVNIHGKELKLELKRLQDNEQPWDDFIKQGSQVVRLFIAKVIQDVRNLTQEIGKIDLPESTLADLNLRLPEVAPVDEQDMFLAMTIEQLKQQLDTQQRAINTSVLGEETISEAELKQLEEYILDLQRHRQSILEQNIPKVEHRIYDTSGSEIGRAIGETIDWALFFLPTTALSKVGKVAKLSEKTIKVALNVQKSAKIAKKTVEKMPPSTASNLLSLLSVSTWTEKIGGLFNDPSQIVLMPDPDFQANVDAQAKKVTADIQQLYADLERKHELVSLHKLEGLALDQKKREIQRIEQRIREAQDELIVQQEKVQEQREQQRIKTLETYCERALRQWLTQFESQIQGIEKYLEQYIKDYWQNIVGEQLDIRMGELQQIELQITQLPVEKQQRLDILLYEERQIQSVLLQLSKGSC